MNNSNIIKLINENGVEAEYGEIPDLWHAAHKSGISRHDREQILQVWHMAHDLKAVIEGQDQARLVPTEVKS